jgi:hypothetical protein
MGLASELSKLFPGRQRPGINPRMMPRPLPVLLTLAPGAAEFQPFIRMSIPLKTAKNRHFLGAAFFTSQLSGFVFFAFTCGPFRFWAGTGHRPLPLGAF